LLLRQRLSLFRSILCMMSDLTTSDSALHAWLLGRPVGGLAQLTAEGRPTPSANPWLRGFYHDIVALQTDNHFQQSPIDCMHMDDNLEYQNSSFKFVLSHARVREPPMHISPSSVGPMSCLLCERKCVDARGLGIHCSLTHEGSSATTRRITILCASNQCPWCLWTFMDRRSQRDHIRARDKRGQCPMTNRLPRAQIQLLATLTCPRCAWKVADIGALHLHLRTFCITPHVHNPSAATASSAASAPLSQAPTDPISPFSTCPTSEDSPL